MRLKKAEVQTNFKKSQFVSMQSDLYKRSIRGREVERDTFYVIANFVLIFGSNFVENRCRGEEKSLIRLTS